MHHAVPGHHDGRVRAGDRPNCRFFASLAAAAASRARLHKAAPGCWRWLGLGFRCCTSRRWAQHTACCAPARSGSSPACRSCSFCRRWPSARRSPWPPPSIVEWVTGKRTMPHDLLRTIARFSGFGLLAYAYIKLWDLAAVTYYGRTPAVNQRLSLLNEQTPYGFGFWVGEMILGILVPVILFLVAALQPQPGLSGAGRAAGHVGHRRQPLERDRVRAWSCRWPIRPGAVYSWSPAAYCAQPDRMGGRRRRGGLCLAG